MNDEQNPLEVSQVQTLQRCETKQLIDDQYERDRLLREAKERANKVIIEAEQFKAMIEQPKGKYLNVNSLDSNIANKGENDKVPQSMDCDDDFFHLTCHIDPNLKTKIEKGEFVELDKLLPRDRSDSHDDGRVDLVHRDGQTFFRAHQRDNKIGGIRKWEQAFRIYAAIYSSANPHRSAEIWQYVYVINTAASSYVWEDVTQYDYTFRQLMAANPTRSWAKTYNQMWNLSMRNPLSHNRSGHGYQNYAGQVSNTNQGQGSRKPKYCWKFNKGICSEPYCKFPHKCYYCHGRHGINTCIKKDKKGGPDQGNSGNNNSPRNRN